MNAQRTVLFVCLHGAAKSVLAAADWERLAAARGVDARGVARGLEPDPEIAPRVVAALREEGLDPGRQRPTRVTRDDLAGAWRVVAFGCDLGGLAGSGQAVERWDDVPAVGDDVVTARAAIRRRLERLLDECAADAASGAPRARGRCPP
ncbi:MAG: hypothetical protein HY614_08020 [Candidatus Rokubacteria bacterium]|nr:hypothetical protein [Candidatus Rokubacteria bacterium]